MLSTDVQQRPTEDHSKQNCWLPESPPPWISILEDWEADTKRPTSLEMREEERPLPWSTVIHVTTSPPSSNLAILEESVSWYIDGTFNTCPQVFYQIKTTHAEIPNPNRTSWVFPGVYSHPYLTHSQGTPTNTYTESCDASTRPAQLNQQLRGGVEQEVRWSFWSFPYHDMELLGSCPDGAVCNRQKIYSYLVGQQPPPPPKKEEEEGMLGQGHCQLLHRQPTGSLRWSSH